MNNEALEIYRQAIDNAIYIVGTASFKEISKRMKYICKSKKCEVMIMIFVTGDIHEDRFIKLLFRRKAT